MTPEDPNHPNYFPEAKQRAGGDCSRTPCSAELVERYVASIQQEHDRWNTFREKAMDQQQFSLVARYGDVCDALKMAINQARKILLPNVEVARNNGWDTEDVSASHARNLERERNALRAECQRLRVMVSAMADPVKITVPRELFENLIEDAIELRGERDWHKDEPRCGYQKAFLELVARIKESIALRDA